MGGASSDAGGDRVTAARDRLRKRVTRVLKSASSPPGFADLCAFQSAREDGLAPPPAVMKRLAAAFDAILDGEHADSALRLQRRGRKPPTAAQVAERVGVAFRVERLRRGGASKDAAIAQVAQGKRGHDHDRVKKWYEMYRDDAVHHLQLIDILKQKVDY
jgi:hypothetical protein